ncbi:peptidase [Lacibacterium aquatile]|uniref:Peptidase n=1 Tax=Lacibacterium aquatile TaxID=1168082 RepID=A0ABW5DU33_9PROT
MTYCLGMLLKDGLVMISDSRTNAGLDHIAVFRKMTIWNEPGDRVIVIAAAGNLAITQEVIHFLHVGVTLPDEEEPKTIMSVTSMFEAAQLVGAAVRRSYRIDGERLEKENSGFNCSFLIGGQVGGDKARLFQVYSAGNFIESTADTCYFQIGEMKYGKPILDRALSYDTKLTQAGKLALISMDSTLRSNLSVGLPLDMAVYHRDSLELGMHRQFDEHDPYFAEISQRWSKSLKDAFLALPDPSW